jgi:hypothetical protein
VAAAAKEPEKELPPVEPPRLLMQPEPRRSRRLVKVLLAVVVAAAIGAAGFQTRRVWWPKVTTLLTPGAQTPVKYAPIGLVLTDVEGQLQVRWDRYSSAVRQATGGRLAISDVAPLPREVHLDQVTLQSGSFTYAREGESVTVALSLDEPNGEQAHDSSSFLGNLPAPKVAGNPELRKQRDALVEESSRLRQDLAAEQERNRKLKKELDDARSQLREQARKRLAAQAPK